MINQLIRWENPGRPRTHMFNMSANALKQFSGRNKALSTNGAGYWKTWKRAFAWKHSKILIWYGS